MQKSVSGLPITISYIYDDANRLIVVNGQTFTTYVYGGLGDRQQQNPSTLPLVAGTGINYTLDLNAGLTQVLSDGANNYLYGNGRISQPPIPDFQSTEYFLGYS